MAKKLSTNIIQNRYKLRVRPSAVRATAGPVTRPGDTAVPKEPRVGSADVSVSKPEDEAGPLRQERSKQHNLLSKLKRAEPDYSHFVETSHRADDADGDPSRFSSKEEDVSSRLTSLPESEDLPLPPRRRAYVEDVPDEGDTVLTRDQTAVVQEARQSMTEAERRLVDTRNHVVNNIDLHVNSAFLERDNPGDSSCAKGKTVDPHNWGDADLS
ncbi:hypothetical protein H0H81_001847, partial [Sphagnurus paluster]